MLDIETNCGWASEIPHRLVDGTNPIIKSHYLQWLILTNTFQLVQDFVHPHHRDIIAIMEISWLWHEGAGLELDVSDCFWRCMLINLRCLELKKFKGWEDDHYHAMFARHWSLVMRCLQAPQSECPRHWWTKRMPQGILCHQPCKANGLCERPSTIHWLVVSSCWRSTGSLRLSRTDPKQPERASSDGNNYHELNNQHYTFLKRHDSATTSDVRRFGGWQLPFGPS